MRKVYKYRIYLTNGQRRILEQQLEECRWLYNEILATRKRAYEDDGISLGLYDLQNAIPAWKRERPSLKLVHSLVLQNVNMRVDLAFQAFFRRVKAGDPEAGYPRFKGRGRYDSLTYAQYGNGARLDGDQLILSKVGAVHVVLHRPVEGQIKTVTLRRAATGKWYVSFSCAVERKPLPQTTLVVGIDLGLEKFATLATGPDGHKPIPNPRFFRRDEADLKRVQQRLSDAKDTPDWPAYHRRKKALVRIHERITFRRTNFAHQKSRELVDAFQIIAFEDLEPQQMGARTGRGMRKSIADAAWSQLVQSTCAKAEEAGRTVVLVDPRNTSQMCSRCGELVPKDLSVRVHECPYCGLVLDRDQNAAINILARGLQHLRL